MKGSAGPFRASLKSLVLQILRTGGRARLEYQQKAPAAPTWKAFLETPYQNLTGQFDSV